MSGRRRRSGVTPPGWAGALLRWLAPPGRADELVGDHPGAPPRRGGERGGGGGGREAHRRRVAERGRAAATLLTSLDAMDMARALLVARLSPGVSWLDFKLGLRMLVRYPALTVVGGLTLAVTIGGLASWAELNRERRSPDIPLPDGDRLVRVELRDDRATLVGLAGPDALRDVAALPSFAEVGAYRTGGWNLVVGEDAGVPLAGAEITPPALRLARVRPALGRLLREEDAAPGATPVLLLGHDVWRARFGADPGAVGRTVRLGGEDVVVVGVMPPDFRYPVSHRLWRPLAATVEDPPPAGDAGAASREARAGLVGAQVVGRLAEGATRERAAAELASFLAGPGRAAVSSDRPLRVRVLPFAGEPPGGGVEWGIVGLHLAMVLILAAASVNIATLMYARTATRVGEMAVRNALGASRGRIVGQLFVEALVLASVAAGVGLAGARWGLEWLLGFYWTLTGDVPPFWFDPGLSASTVLFVGGLSVVGAVVVGLVPALVVTRRDLRGTLQAGAGGGRAGFGGVWGWIVVVQVAFTVFGLLPAVGITAENLRDRAVRAAFPTADYLTARVEGDPASLAASLAALERRLEREPAVRGVALADLLPGVQTRGGPMEIRRASADAGSRTVSQVWVAAVDDGFVETFGSSVMAGRGLHPGDAEPGARSVLVNRAFARRYLGGANPVGTRIRPAEGGPDAPWMEIVGMVDDVGLTPTDLGQAPYLYLPLRPGAAGSLRLAVRMRDDAAAFAPTLRRLALEVDPGLRLHDVATLDDMVRRSQRLTLMASLALLAIVGLALVLAGAGIFALTSLAVSRRRHEIGVRRALGARGKGILVSILGRAAAQVGLGIALGNVLLLALAVVGGAELGDVAGSLVVVSAVVGLAALLACLPSARRALATQPVEVLGAE